MWWPFRRQSFRDVVRRQLGLFEQEHGELVDRSRAALEAYNAAADPELAQVDYAEYDDLAEDVEMHLYEMCERLGSSMEDGPRQRYVREFDRQARAAYGDLLPRLRFPGMSED